MKKRKEEPELEQPDVSDLLFSWIKNLEIVLLILCSACLGAMWVETRYKRESSKKKPNGERLTIIVGTMPVAEQLEKDEKDGSV